MDLSAYPCPQYQPPLITPEALAALLANITAGVKEVQYADKKVIYHSLSDMWRIYYWMVGIMNPCSGAGRQTKVSAQYCSGLGYPNGNGWETEEHSFRG